MSPAGSRRLPGAPIGLQIIALVVGALVAAQLVTLALTLLLPPAPPQQYSLAAIARALRGATAPATGGRPLIRSLEPAPPSLESPGWMVSPKTTAELAGLMNTPVGDVRLLFYAPPPLAGATPPPPSRGPRLAAGLGRRQLLLAGFAPPGGMGGGPAFGGMGPGGLGPGGVGPGGMGPGGMLPGGMGPGGMSGGGLRPPESEPGGTAPDGWRSGGAAPATKRSPAPASAPTAAARVPSPGGSATPGAGAATGAAGGGRPAAPPIQAIRLPRSPLDAAVFESASAPLEPAPPPERRSSQPAAAPAPSPAAASAAPAAAPAAPAIAPPAAARPEAPAAARLVWEASGGVPLAAPAAPSVFGFTPPSAYVEGEFVAALRTPAGWVTVRPRPEGFPNSWQRRVLLWFALSLALVAPPAYLLTRRLVTPLQRFADAAERLGREPTADLPPLAGPAEIGRAAAAFNLMRLRLKRYVEDRTGMISAITHDLRTPLARMRFKLERTPPAVRAALTRDVDQMEAMIASVLSFMRDELGGAARETADLRSILECVVDDAGERATLEAGPSVAAYVDLLAIQRVFENLVSNAIKYGGGAQVRLLDDGADVVVEVADEGPGLSDEELANVFKPFYRGAKARSSGAPGVGLGLAVSRSILRAHGGELTLVSTASGLIARARIPLASPVQRAA